MYVFCNNVIFQPFPQKYFPQIYRHIEILFVLNGSKQILIISACISPAESHVKVNYIATTHLGHQVYVFL